MSKMSAYRYAQALVLACKDLSTKKDILDILADVAFLFKNKKLIEVVRSPLVRKEDKIRLFSGDISGLPKEYVNLVKILSFSQKLDLIPHIYKQYKKELSRHLGRYVAVLESDETLKQVEVKELMFKLEKNLGVGLELEFKKTNYNGVRVKIDDLGLRVGFSQSDIKSELLAHILRGI